MLFELKLRSLYNLQKLLHPYVFDVFDDAFDVFDEIFNRLKLIYILLPAKLPENVKSSVIEQWLQGKTRDSIAMDRGLIDGAGLLYYLEQIGVQARIIMPDEG